MKKMNKILTFLSVLTLTLFIASCVEDDDFGIPNVSIVEPDIAGLGQLTTFSAVVQRYLDADADGDEVGIFDDNDVDLYIEGYVVSSDQSGNFFEEIIVQNSPDGNDPGSEQRRGLNVEINVRSLSDTYEFGRKVYIKLNGLAIGEEHGVYTLGKANGSVLEQLQEFEYQEFIIRSSEVATITPKVTTIGNLSEEDENTFIQLDNVQIELSDLALTFAGEASDQFDGFRTLVSCDEGGTIDLQTSTFADFKSVPVPQNRGSIQGIFSRDFRDDFNVFILNTTADINFDNTQRCDPVFEETFNSATDNTNLNINGWINYAEAGSELWTEQVFSNNGYAEFTAYRTFDASNIGWLITPGIDMDAQDGEILSFETEHAYPDSGHEPLEVLISTDFDGTEAGILTATWTSLEFTSSLEEDYDTWYNFVNSGNIDLSSYTGTAYIAFKYTGSDTMNLNTTMHVENVKIVVL